MAISTTFPSATPRVVDERRRRAALLRARECKIVLPTFSQLANPGTIPQAIGDSILEVDPDAPRPENLWRIHWHNGSDRRRLVDTPAHFVLPQAFTGVKAKIVVLVGANFPMIGAHKVLPAYTALATLLVTGQFDPRHHKAVWPSTGNYCRGGIAISRILGCTGIAVLPEGMSRERFDWLEKWVSSPSDIRRTPGTESNVKEIYDASNELAKNEENVILNQFALFSNYMIHRACTGAACERVFARLTEATPGLRLAAFVAATGSAGTLAAGDHLKARLGTRIAAVESLECPTMLENGYGEHNIQGIGDKHIPLIHNVMNTDFVVDVSDRATDSLNVLLGSDVGRAYLRDRQQVDPGTIARLAEIGISGIANVVASIKLAKHMAWDENDVIVTIATDHALLYKSERAAFAAKNFPAGFDDVNAGEVFGAFVSAAMNDHLLELRRADRLRIFNLGYYTWVEQQGVTLEDFDRRKDQRFWDNLSDQLPVWDRLIAQFNADAATT